MERATGFAANHGYATPNRHRKAKNETGFIVIARRWVVERTFAWLGCCHRLAKDWKKTMSHSNAWLTIAAIRRQPDYRKTMKSNT